MTNNSGSSATMRWRRVFAWLASGIITAVGMVLLAGALARAAIQRESKPPGQLVNVGGRLMHINCQGSGETTVVLDAGLMDFSVLWTDVQSRVAEFTRVCSYDRRGLGWSEPGSLPRTSHVVVADLRDLLEAAEIGPPYLLVGHSYGGLNARRFAQRYPQLVSGLVLVDAAHVDQLRRIPVLDSSRSIVTRQFESLTRLNMLGMLALRRGAIPARGLAEEPARQYRSVLAATAYFRGALSELDAMPASFAAQPEDSVTLTVPIVVVSRGRAELLPHVRGGEDLEQEWRVMQREFLALSNRSTQVVATNSAHDIHIQEPQVVTDAIRSVINALPQASLKQARGPARSDRGGLLH